MYKRQEQVPESKRQYTGRAEAYVADEKMEEFKEKGLLPEDLYVMGEDGTHKPVEPVENQFFILRSELFEKKTMLGKYQKGKIVPLAYAKAQPYGVKP